MTAKTNFRGSFTALVTPFKNGAVDEKAFRNLVDWQIGEGTNGLVPVGTTGESPTLSHEEHRKVVQWCVEQARGLGLVVAVRAVCVEQVALDGDTPPFVGEDVNTNAICAVFPEALELPLCRERAGQVFGLANIDPVMGRPVIGAVVVSALRHEVHRGNRLEPRLQGPRLEVIALARLPHEIDASLSHIPVAGSPMSRVPRPAGKAI